PARARNCRSAPALASPASARIRWASTPSRFDPTASRGRASVPPRLAETSTIETPETTRHTISPSCDRAVAESRTQWTRSDRMLQRACTLSPTRAKLGGPPLHLPPHSVRLSDSPSVRLSRRPEPQPFRCEAVDHDLLFEQGQRVDVRDELVGFEQVLKGRERARHGEPAHFHSSVRQVEVQTADLDRGTDQGRSYRLHGVLRDTVGEQDPRAEP